MTGFVLVGYKGVCTLFSQLTSFLIELMALTVVQCAYFLKQCVLIVHAVLQVLV